MSAEDTTLAQIAEHWGPRDLDEGRASARAVIEHREFLEEYKAFEELTEFERELMRLAYLRGRQEVADALDRALGPAAATADADALRRAVADVKDLDVRVKVAPRLPVFADKRAVHLVTSARRNADAVARADRG